MMETFSGSAIRQAAVAGLFYPADPTELRAVVNGLLPAVGSQPAGQFLETPDNAAPPKAVIAPHAGYVYSGAVAGAAYRLLAKARGKISRVVLLGPSHCVAFTGMAATSAHAYETPLGLVPVDRQWLDRARDLPQFGFLDEAHEGEHCLETQLPFLQVVLGDFSLVPLICGRVGAEPAADVLDALWGGPETLIVVSSDLSHYLDYQACRRLDERTCAAIERLDPVALSPEQACGAAPVNGLLAAARRRGLRVKTLDLRNSGDTAGPRHRVVGYGAWAFWEQNP
jgi:AmmeMemoRadiSam system protein B